MSSESKVVVIVDDNEEVRNNYAHGFREAQFTVYEGQDGREGLDLVQLYKPDILITGIDMPNMSGFDLLKAVKKDAATSGIPVYILSHLDRTGDKHTAEELGCAGFIIVSMDSPKEAVAQVEDLLLRRPYKVKINVQELDAPRLIQDLNLPQDLILELKQQDAAGRSFTARMIREDERPKEAQGPEETIKLEFLE